MKNYGAPNNSKLNKIFYLFWREFNLKFSQYSEVFVLRIGKHRKASYTYTETVQRVAQSVGLRNDPCDHIARLHLASYRNQHKMRLHSEQYLTAFSHRISVCGC